MTVDTMIATLKRIFYALTATERALNELRALCEQDRRIAERRKAEGRAV